MSRSGSVGGGIGLAVSGLKIHLDECVPWPLHKLLPDHHCETAQQRGWGGITNGDLLRLAESEFDLFITADQNIKYQQNLAGRTIAILQLSTNKLRELVAAAEVIRAAVAAIEPGGFRQLKI